VTVIQPEKRTSAWPSASSCSRRPTASLWLRRLAVPMKPSFWRSSSSATSAVLAKPTERIAFSGGTGSMVTDTVRIERVCTSSGARKSGPTSRRGHSAIQ
jgi:hypothetical protein